MIRGQSSPKTSLVAVPAQVNSDLSANFLVSLEPQNVLGSVKKLSTEIESFLIHCRNSTGNEPGTNSEILGLLFYSTPDILYKSLLTYVRESRQELFEYLTSEKVIVKLYSLCSQIHCLDLSEDLLDPFFTNEYRARSGFNKKEFTNLLMTTPIEKLHQLQLLQMQSDSFYSAVVSSLENAGARLSNLEDSISAYQECPDLHQLHAKISFRTGRVMGSAVVISPLFTDLNSSHATMDLFNPQLVSGFLYNHTFTELVYPRRFEDQIISYTATLSTVEIDARAMNALSRVASITGNKIDQRIYQAIQAVYQMADHDWLHHLTSLSPTEMDRFTSVIEDQELLTTLRQITVDLWQATPELKFLPVEALAIKINFISSLARNNPDSETLQTRQQLLDAQGQFIQDLLVVQEVLNNDGYQETPELIHYLLYVYCSRFYQVFNIHDTKISGPTEKLVAKELDPTKEKHILYEFLTKNSIYIDPKAVAQVLQSAGVTFEQEEKLCQAILDLPVVAWSPLFAKTLLTLRESYFRTEGNGQLGIKEGLSAFDHLKLEFLTRGTGYLGWVLETDAKETPDILLKRFGVFMQAMKYVYYDLAI